MNSIDIPISKQPELVLISHRSIGDHSDPPKPLQFVVVSDVFQDLLFADLTGLCFPCMARGAELNPIPEIDIKNQKAYASR